jgi:hypothetical protein
VGSIQPPIQSVPGAVSSVAKQPGREVDHSFPFHESKWIYASTPPICLRDVDRCNLKFCLQVEVSSVLMQLVVYLSCKKACPLFSVMYYHLMNCTFVNEGRTVGKKLYC